MKGLFQKRLGPIACEYIDMFLTFFSIFFMVYGTMVLEQPFSFVYDSGIIVTPMVRIGESCLAL